MAAPSDKPTVILVAAGIRADAGSEPSKGWVWANALGRFYRLEILTMPYDAAFLHRDGVPENWRVHAVGQDFPPGSALKYYPAYQRWGREVIQYCRTKLLPNPAIAGLHHITLGSFRVMPRYDELGIPYTLGPLGGGESIPWSLLPRLRLPGREIVSEALRLPMNYAFALLPGLRAVLKGSSCTLATTQQSLSVVQAMGARQGAALFPDALDLAGDDAATILAGRERQAAALPGRLRCICAGRALWWKGMHLAIDFIALLRQRGIDATLDIYTQGKALAAWQARAAGLGIAEHVTFHGIVGRNELLARYPDFHLFLNPTMHDSSSPALVEAYFTGLPSMTLGLAGAAHIITPETGLNDRVETVEKWLEAGHRMVAAWMDDPGRWLAASRAAKARAHVFDHQHIERQVQEHLVPIFGGTHSE